MVVMKSLDVSVILTFHDEGVVVRKTFLALERMLKKLEEGGITYEVIAHVDNGDNKTRKCIDVVKEKLGLRVFENGFGEPAQSRNFAVKKAKGKYVCLMDGDDLFSENWLIDAYNLQEETNDEIILHPEYNITFGLGEQPRLWRMKDSFDMNEDILILLGRNRWCSGTFLKSDVAERIPYEEAVGCYGYEDWHYNCETRAKGIKHNVVPRSILFYRVRKGSTYSRHTGQNTTIKYTSAFDLDNMKRIYKSEFENLPVKNADPDRTLRMLRYGHKVLRHTPVLKLVDRRVTKKIERYRAEKAYKVLPKFLVSEWKKMNRIDGELYPDEEIIARMPIYSSEVDYYGKTYCRMVHRLDRNPDYVFMPPIMNVGGTEKVLENYLNVIYELHPEWSVVVFGRLPDDHPYSIPSNVTFIDFDGITKGLSDWDRLFLVTKFVVQMKVKRMHIINNEFYYRWAVDNKQLIIDNKIALNCSFFMHEFTEDENRIQSFADSYLIELEPCINKIFTDNAVIAKDLIGRGGISGEKVSVHHQPVSLKFCVFSKPNDGGVHKVLWASRVAPQKRPDILKKIAERLPDNYVVDVYGRIQKPYFRDDYFRGAKNISYKGAFSDVSDLPVGDYDVYLYTAQTDGIPNILLEIAALGLPIVATNEGGVSDLIEDGRNGRLVELNDIDGYIDGVRDIVENKKGAGFVKRIQDKIKKRHSWDSYRKVVKRDF